MSKYRVIEEKGRFYPQLYRLFMWWSFREDNPNYYMGGRIACERFTLDGARSVIESHRRGLINRNCEPINREPEPKPTVVYESD